MKAAIIDSREPDHIKRLNFGCPSMVQTLETGDLHIATDDDKLLVVERKAAMDFVNSIKDGRLFNQVARAKQITPYVYVAIVGSILPAKHGKTYINGNLTGWDYSAIQGVMLSIQELGASIVFCADENDFLPCMVRLANRSRDVIPVMPVREATIFGGAETILASLPGIGAKKATDLLKVFPNVGTALWFLTDLDSSEQKIAGIADGTKQNIIKVIGGSLNFNPTANELEKTFIYSNGEQNGN
jgi:Fanconi anemia group M protein